MRWENFFDDLEGQLAAEWEAERAALDTEAERLRLSRVALRERLAMLVERERDGAPPSFEVSDGTVLSAEVTGVGADWVALDGGRSGGLVVPFASIGTIGMPHADMLRSATRDRRRRSASVSSAARSASHSAASCPSRSSKKFSQRTQRA